MVDAGDLGDVLDVIDDAVERRFGLVDERGEDVHPDHAAGRGDAAQVLVAEVAMVVAQRAGARMRRDDGAGRQIENVVDRRRREVRHVEQNPEPLELRERAHAARGQPAPGRFVRRALGEHRA